MLGLAFHFKRTSIKNTHYVLIAVILLNSSAFASYKATSWKILDGYEVKFTSKNPTGIFRKIDGNINFDKQDLGSASFDITIDATSINTGNGIKNKHAKSDKWLNVEKFPTIKFSSNEVTKKGSA